MKKEKVMADVDMLKNGANCSRIAWNFARETFANRPVGLGNPVCNVEAGFANFIQIGAEQVAITSDGIGTKVEVAERMNCYSTLGFDLMAMVVDDLACMGFEPCSVSNILDVDSLDETIVTELMLGLKNAAHFCQVAITGGEIAELGARIGGYGNNMHFNWCATALGVLPKWSKPITGKDIEAGHTIIALKNEGLRSNGFSLARKILEQNYNSGEWHYEKFEEKNWGDILLTPSTIYAPLITALQKHSITITGVAHITGAGIPGNLGRILKQNNLGATLDNLFPIASWQKELLTLGKITLEEGYKHWNMGNGMLIVCPVENVTQIEVLAKEMHYDTRVAGVITKTPHTINIGNITYIKPEK